MLSQDIKEIADEMINLFGHKDAIYKYEKTMRNKKYYKEEHEDSIQTVINYMKDDWVNSRNKKISSLFERRILNFSDFTYKFY
ncbi:hypothetical protein EBQ93_01975 [bacterium]|nr:hypothetical protein [bacterium]